MARSPRPFVAQPRHPLTGKKFRVSARSDRELQAIMHHVDTLRESLRLGLKSEEEIDRALRRLVHGPVTLARAGAAYVAQTHLAKNTRAGIASFLRDAGAPLARLEIAELSAGRVQQWLHKLAARGVSPEAREQYWRRLRSLVRFAASREWIGRVPWEGWRPLFRGKKKTRDREAARDLEELARLLDAARAEDAQRTRFRFERRGATWVACGLLPDVEAKITTTTVLGLRQGELAGLRWLDVRATEGIVQVARQWDSPLGRPHLPKGGRAQSLAATPALFELLERHRARLVAAGLYHPAGPVFPNVRASAPGDPRAYSQGECLTRRILRAVIRRAQLPNEKAWSPHSLRDTFATLEELAHADLATLALRTRHVSIGSLVRYLRARKRELPPPGFALPPASPPIPKLAPPAVDKK